MAVTKPKRRAASPPRRVTGSSTVKKGTGRKTTASTRSRTRRVKKVSFLGQVEARLSWCDQLQGLYIACAGFALSLVGLAGDVVMHRMDTHLASHETPLTLGNVSHVALMLGVVIAITGAAIALFATGGRSFRTVPGQVAAALLLTSALVGVPTVYIDNIKHHVDSDPMKPAPALAPAPAKHSH